MITDYSDYYYNVQSSFIIAADEPTPLYSFVNRICPASSDGIKRESRHVSQMFLLLEEYNKSNESYKKTEKMAETKRQKGRENIQIGGKGRS